MKGQLVSFEIFMIAIVGTILISIIAQQSSTQKEFYQERLDQGSSMSSSILFANTSLNTTKSFQSTYCYSIAYDNGTTTAEDSTCAANLAATCSTTSNAERVTICGQNACTIRVRSC